MGKRTRPSLTALRQAALRYAAQGWSVVPGTYVVGRPRTRRAGGTPALSFCSCRRPGCPTPGAHPLDVNWPEVASRDPDTVRWWWSAEPHGIVLPTGSTFDVFDVPAETGACALRLWLGSGTPAGPVARTPDRRWLFFSAPSGRSFPELADSCDIRHLGPGDYLLAPPTRPAGGPAVQWERPPSPLNRRLADATVVARLLHRAAEAVLATAASRPRRRLRPLGRLGIAQVR